MLILCDAPTKVNAVRVTATFRLSALQQRELKAEHCSRMQYVTEVGRNEYGKHMNSAHALMSLSLHHIARQSVVRQAVAPTYNLYYSAIAQCSSITSSRVLDVIIWHRLMP